MSSTVLGLSNWCSRAIRRRWQRSSDDDFLRGYAGNNTVAGNAGKDLLSSGDGEDGFVFTRLVPQGDLSRHVVPGAKALDADGSGKGKAVAIVTLAGVGTLDSTWT